MTQHLTSRCGHHCGYRRDEDVVTERHCPCPECHAGATPPKAAA